MATTDSGTQQSLSSDPTFRKRVKSALSTIAWQVANEINTTPGHTARATYARNALQSLDAVAGQISQYIVTRPNLVAGNVTTDLTTGTPIVKTDVIDAAIQSQIATDWDFLSGVI